MTKIMSNLKFHILKLASTKYIYKWYFENILIYKHIMKNISLYLKIQT